jgi:hypothetical protein
MQNDASSTVLLRVRGFVFKALSMFGASYITMPVEYDNTN